MEGGEGSKSWTQTLSSVNVPLVTQKGARVTLISELPQGPYQASALAIGEEKDLAQRRGDGLGFVRSAAIEQFLGEMRAALLGASGVTGVPGKVRVLANPAFAAYSTADGNVFLSMGWLEYLESADEIAAILAHELSHVLLKHHSSDMIASMQRRGQALHELAVGARASASRTRTVAKSDQRALSREQMVLDVTDKLALPAWNRRQEREADLLGVDLLVRAGHAPGAMVSMLEKLQAWEQKHTEQDDAFWDRMQQTAQANPGEALSAVFQKSVSAVAASHPKTSERLDEAAEYLDRHYGELEPRAPQVAPWKRVATRPEVAQVLKNYDLAFSAKKLLEKGKPQESYAYAKQSATGRTAVDAYPNWVLAYAATALGRQNEALEAFRRALDAPEPVPQIYDEVIWAYERAGNVTAALTWTDKASATFGESPRWTPTKIRLLRKAGRTTEAGTLAASCAVSTPEWKRQCQEANETPAGAPARRGGSS
jgi:Zn-dependent protease with chaperone function